MKFYRYKQRPKLGISQFYYRIQYVAKGRNRLSKTYFPIEEQERKTKYTILQLAIFHNENSF